MRISKDPKVRRQEIMDAARELFLKNGYENTSVDDIVRRLSVAKGLFYYYFPKKDAILAAIADEFVQEVSRQFSTQLRDQTEDFSTLIRRILGYYLTTMKHNENLLNIKASNGTVVSLFVRGRLEDHAIREVTELLRENPSLLPLRYPEYTIHILVRGLSDLYLNGVQDLDVLSTLIEEILGLSRLSPEPETADSHQPHPS
ncbi:MAG: TetR/AcrR family transcriptional regulator [Clostridiaceae bacterium]